MIDDFLFRREYYQRVLSVRGDKLLAYWPLWDVSGTAAINLQGIAARNGTYTNGTRGQAGIGDGRSSALFATSYCNIYSASLDGVFTGAKGSSIIWLKVLSSSVWTDGNYRAFYRFEGATGGNQLHLFKSATNGEIDFQYQAGGTSVIPAITGLTTTDWFCLGMTWKDAASGDAVVIYLNGIQQGAASTGTGTWAGALSTITTMIGASNATPDNPWSGWEAHAVVWSDVLTAGEMRELARI